MAERRLDGLGAAEPFLPLYGPENGASGEAPETGRFRPPEWREWSLASATGLPTGLAGVNSEGMNMPGFQKTLVVIAVSIAIVGFVLADAGSIDAGVLIVLLSLIIGMVLFARSNQHRARERKAKQNRKRLIDSVDRHRAALSRNLKRAVKKNDYGAVIADNRHETLKEFFASIDLDAEILNFEEAARIVLEQLDLRAAEDRESGFDATSLPADGHAFEEWVAQALAGFGWKAGVTSGSGDQGIDVIAEKHGRRLGIQCKLSSSTIGNKAVQEAHAGRAFYEADAVAVLSNASYTSGAKDLASATGVELLSHHDIPDLYGKVFREDGRETPG